MLAELHLKNVGPSAQFDVEFGSRLNLFTGDNGLGKTFLLDVAWWALTGTWAGEIVHPTMLKDKTLIPEILRRLSFNKTGHFEPSYYYFQNQSWMEYPIRAPGVVVYARVDGGFSVWDPNRNFWIFDTEGKPKEKARPYLFKPGSIWNILEGDGRTLCNGLIRDWVSWQYQPEQGENSPFQILKRVLARLSPPSMETLKPGKPTRVSVNDVLDIPTIDFPYGSIPVTLTSAGVKRILSLAYLLVWTWYEHLQAVRLLGSEPSKNLVLIIDEVEAHLHPLWQRSLLPAVFEVATALDKQIQTQVIATTHSPLVLASIEPYFDETRDRLFLFELKDRDVTLSQVPWAKQGDTVGWLTSEIFGLKQARSPEAEQAIEAAETFMRGEDMSAYPDDLHAKEQIHNRLLQLLPGHDPFWPRWIVKTGE